MSCKSSFRQAAAPARFRHVNVVLLVSFCLGLVAGCAAPPQKRVAQEEPSETKAPIREPESSTAASRASFTRNYMIYSVEWGRAEEMAETLEPALQARYGPEARVVPHLHSNKIFIYLPPNDETGENGPARRIAVPPRSR